MKGQKFTQSACARFNASQSLCIMRQKVICTQLSLQGCPPVAYNFVLSPCSCADRPMGPALPSQPPQAQQNPNEDIQQPRTFRGPHMYFVFFFIPFHIYYLYLYYAAAASASRRLSNVSCTIFLAAFGSGKMRSTIGSFRCTNSHTAGLYS